MFQAENKMQAAPNLKKNTTTEAHIYLVMNTKYAPETQRKQHKLKNTASSINRRTNAEPA